MKEKERERRKLLHRRAKGASHTEEVGRVDSLKVKDQTRKKPHRRREKGGKRPKALKQGALTPSEKSSTERIEKRRTVRESSPAVPRRAATSGRGKNYHTNQEGGGKGR